MGTDPREYSFPLTEKATRMHADPRPHVVETARPDELVLLLFGGAVRFGREAVMAFEAGDRDRGLARIARVRAILHELDDKLDRKAGTIGRHLGAIYDYLLRRLDPDSVTAEGTREVISDIETLAETWSVLVERRDAELAEA